MKGKGIEFELDKASFRTARECAFEAGLAARRAHALAEEIVNVSAEVSVMSAELPRALIAACQAKEAARLAEIAATDPRVQQPYDQARKHCQTALRHEQTCAAALRQLSARIPNYAEIYSAIEQNRQLQHALMRTPQSFEAEPMFRISVDDMPAVGLRKDPLQLEEIRPVPEQRN